MRKAQFMLGALAAMGLTPPLPAPPKAPLRLEPEGPQPVRATREQLAAAREQARREVSARKARH